MPVISMLWSFGTPLRTSTKSVRVIFLAFASASSRLSATISISVSTFTFANTVYDVCFALRAVPSTSVLPDLRPEGLEEVQVHEHPRENLDEDNRHREPRESRGHKDDGEKRQGVVDRADADIAIHLWLLAKESTPRPPRRFAQAIRKRRHA